MFATLLVEFHNIHLRSRWCHSSLDMSHLLLHCQALWGESGGGTTIDIVAALDKAVAGACVAATSGVNWPHQRLHAMQPVSQLPLTYLLSSMPCVRLQQRSREIACLITLEGVHDGVMPLPILVVMLPQAAQVCSHRPCFISNTCVTSASTVTAMSQPEVHTPLQYCS